MGGEYSRIVGREPELRLVDRFLVQAKSRFGVVTIEGQPGIGKTTLWREALSSAEAAGFRVLISRASEAEATLSYAALTDLFSRIAQEDLTPLALPQHKALAGALLLEPVESGLIDERALAAAVLSLLRLMSAVQPVAIGVDDIQWIDSASARVLSFAVRRLDQEPIALIGTARPGTSHLQRRFDLVAESARRQSATLPGLSVAALHEVIKVQTGRSLPRPAVVRIAEVSGGNPFYSLEIAKSLPEPIQGDARLLVPADLTGLLSARLKRLPATTRRALLKAAALTQPASDFVGADELAPAVRAGVIALEGDRVRFVHPLLAAAVLNEVSDRERRRVHRDLAAAAPDPEERARHAALGALGPDSATAAQVEAGAKLARARGAPAAAAELIDMAVALTPEQDREARAGRLVAAAAAWFDAGDLARAEGSAGQALSESQDRSVRARAQHILADLHFRRSSFDQARAAALDGLAMVDEDGELRARLLLDGAFYSASTGDIPSAVGYAREGVAVAQRAAVPGPLGDALACQTMTEFMAGLGFNEERIARARELEDPQRDSAWQMRPSFIHGNLLLYAGRPDDAFVLLEKLHRDSLEQGIESPIPYSCFWLAWASVWRGDITTGRAYADEARQAAALLDDPAALGFALTTAALVHAFDGSTDSARHEARQAIEQFQRLGWLFGSTYACWGLGLAEIAAGNPAGVDTALAPLAAMVTSVGPADPLIGVFLPEEIEALIDLGRTDDARPLLAWFDDRATALDRSWALAAAARCRGLLRAAEGDLEAALADLELALLQHDRANLPLERARSLLVRGRLERRSGQRGQSRRSLTEALDVFDRAGAREWAARARSELERLGGRHPRTQTLTPTEARVAELAASGLTNRQIAQRAFLTVKAVEANLTRVYQKVGARSRGGLARALESRDRVARKDEAKT